MSGGPVAENAAGRGEIAERRAFLRAAERAAYRRARLGDLIYAAPFIGALLLLSPMARAFAKPVTIAGTPLIVVYVFLVWALLIAAAALLARATRSQAAQPGRGDPAASDEDNAGGGSEPP